jgi:DNA mismatch repair protein MutS2
MNKKTFALLEFDVLRGRVAACALSREAAGIILEVEPLREKEEVRALKSMVAAALGLMNSGEEEKREGFPDIGGLLTRLGTDGAVLETDEVLALGLFLERGAALKDWLSKGAGPGPGAGAGENPLLPLLARLPDCSPAAAEIFKLIDREGKLRDLGELKEIKRRIQSLTKELENASARYTGSGEVRRMLQSGVPSQRDGRMVLALKANYRGRIKGIVHEVSSTGQTLFVEPEEVVEKNNELLMENRRLEAEIRRILRETTARLAASREDLEEFHKGILYLETIRARARYGFETCGCFAAEDPPDLLVLKQARHPLLGASAVPLDFALVPGKRAVIITGPNTGGKTVALKTAGLLALMNQWGLPLPAEEGTVLPVFDGVYADIGDEQSLSQSLSTFSAHMTTIADVISRAGEKSLVLLDELGSGTDPEEGSAIAMAILDHFIETKTYLIITTHHGILKNYGYTRQGVENASMEFDGRTLSPTFRIVMGIPGESRALEIAGRNGLPAALVARAKTYLAEEQADISALISGLKEKHRELDEASRAGREEEARLREERRKADLKELRLRQKEIQLKDEGAGSLRRLLEESRKKLENLVREIRENEGELTREKTLKVKEFLSELERSVQEENAGLEREERILEEERRLLAAEGETGETGGAGGAGGAGGKAAIPFLPGVDVLAGPSRRRGRIVRPDKKTSRGESRPGSGPSSWIVEIGSLRISFPETELIPLPPSKEAPGPLIAQADLASPSGALMEISLLGMRLGEALEALRRQIDAALLSGLHGFSVVHGKGDGILQKGVHEYLRNESAVADYYFSRPELGGFGRTEVILK